MLEEITGCEIDSKSAQGLDHQGSVRLLGPVCEDGSAPDLGGSVKFSMHCAPVDKFSRVISRSVQCLRESSVSCYSLSIIELMSCLELALGDVFLLVGKECLPIAGSWNRLSS